MKTIVAVVVAFGALLLSSCTRPYQLQVDGRTLNCQPGAPAGNVTVGSGKINVAPKLICVHGKNVAVMWTLDTDGYVFAHNGIVIDSSDAAFANCTAGVDGISVMNGKGFICLDKNPNSGGGTQTPYNYTVNLQTTTGQPAPMPVDPVIMND